MARDTDDDWIAIGEQEPFHGVFSHARYLRENLTDAELDGFWRSGREDIDHHLRQIRRHFGHFSPRVALDFGCGVGRLTRAMATHVDTVYGIDVAPGMLAEARRGAPANAIYGPDLPVGGVDWINSLIVFQHIPPARGFPLFERLLALLNRGGAVSVQFAIYKDDRATDYFGASTELGTWDGERRRTLIERPQPRGVMMMYDYDLTRIVAHLIRAGVTSVVMEHTDHGGNHGVRIFGMRG